MRRAVGLLVFLNACGSCAKDDPPKTMPEAGAVAMAEVLPRCRGEANRLPIGEGSVVGDVAVSESGLAIGVVRSEGGRRVASLLRTGLDLTDPRTVDIGPSLGDDPPPTPRFHGGATYALWLERQLADAGPRVRTLKVARVGEDGKPAVVATVEQQADESTAFDVAWSADAALAAWDEDAPNKPDASYPSLSERGFVKVQPLNAGAHPRVASPESSDADSPQLVARQGGFWLAWLARRVEEAPSGVEGPGEDKSFRWVEAVMLDAKGEPAGPVRRISSDRGRAVSFDMAIANGTDLVVVVQDEAAVSEGGGARLLRYVGGGNGSPGTDLVDGGVGHALADVVVAADGSRRWLAWSDVAEHAHLTTLGTGLLGGVTTLEPAFDGARVLAEGKDGLYVLAGDKPEIRRFTCH